MHEYALATIDPDEIDSYYDSHDLVRIEMLNLRACADKAHETGPMWFDASISFAIDGVSWPLKLTYDVSFVSAWPCSEGPHPLFFDYVFTRVGVDELVGFRGWDGGRDGRDGKKARSLSPRGVGNGLGGSGKAKAMSGSNVGEMGMGMNGKEGGGGPDDERVLVVDAFGVPDNEVLGRAWCANWGLGAVVADVGRTW